jgi:hypothetical protein
MWLAAPDILQSYRLFGAIRALRIASLDCDLNRYVNVHTAPFAAFRRASVL